MSKFKGLLIVAVITAIAIGVMFITDGGPINVSLHPDVLINPSLSSIIYRITGG